MKLVILYIDPGTGSMLFSLAIGIATAAVFAFKALAVKVHFLLDGGSVSKGESYASGEYVIFSDHKRYWNIFKPICDEFEKRGINLSFLTASEDDPALKENYKYVKTEYLGAGNKPYARLNMMSAKVLLATTPNLDVYQWKRSKGVKKYVHIPHTVDDLAGYRMFGLDYYDAVLVSGANQTSLIRKIEELRPSIAKKEIITVGSLPLDELKKKYEDSKRVYNDNKTILLAPSWGKSGILSRFGEELLEELSKSEYRVIIRPHPQTVTSERNILDPLMNKFDNMEWDFSNDNFSVLNSADLLITDFSGIIFDYTLVFDKPIIYADTEFDTLPYDADWLDEPMWSLRKLPDLGIELKKDDIGRIDDIIKEALNMDILREGRKMVKGECWENIGESARLTVDYLINCYSSANDIL